MRWRAGKYQQVERRWVALVPSLGCCLYAASPTELEPDGVFAVPPATRIFPKRGIIQASPGPAPRARCACGARRVWRAQAPAPGA